MDAFSITLTKMQSLLNIIPLGIKKTKTEVLMIDQKQSSQQIIAKHPEPETIKKKLKKPTKLKNY